MRSVMDLIINYYVSESLNRVIKDKAAVYVTELVSCPMKYYLRKRYPTLQLQLNFNEKILLGKLVHEGIESVLHKIIQLGEDVETEVPVSKEVNGIVIDGRADIVTDNAVIELKTTRSTKDLPHENHKLQAAIYANLLKKPKAVLVYVVLNNEVNILEYEVEPLSDEQLSQLVEELKQRSPAPRFPWECKYCVFKQFCPVRMNNESNT